MAIVHRFINELEELESNQTFCGHKLYPDSNILIIGTFNPDDSSCKKENNATWFYGRKQSKFWRYLPTALTGNSLHLNDIQEEYPTVWKKYCIENKIVIIDLIKKINTNDVLPDFGDKEVECKINFDLTNTEYFDINRAFQNIKFSKVIYSLAWSDGTIRCLRRIRDLTNNDLIQNGCIQDTNQIRYCLTPSRNDAKKSYCMAVNG